MSTPPSRTASSSQRIAETIEDYTTTILALLALVSLLTSNTDTRQQLPGSRFSLGRRMHRLTPDPPPLPKVTPDAVIQRDAHLGFVAEAKKSLDRCQAHWHHVVDQLQKYSDDLIGWWTDDGERILVQSTILLLEISFSADFTTYLDTVCTQQPTFFHNPVALVEFVRRSAAKEFFLLRKRWGDIKDLPLSRALDSGCNVAIESVVATYGPKKFYDSRPPVEHTMLVLWQDLFNAMKSDFPFNHRERAYLLTVELGQLTDDLRHLYGWQGGEHRDVSTPKTAWVREALDAFVALQLATPGHQPGQYVIRFKRLTGDLLSRFAAHRKRRRKPPHSHATQLSLFDPEPSPHNRS